MQNEIKKLGMELQESRKEILRLKKRMQDKEKSHKEALANKQKEIEQAKKDSDKQIRRFKKEKLTIKKDHQAALDDVQWQADMAKQAVGNGTEWVEVPGEEDEDGKKKDYYYNVLSGETSWEKPEETKKKTAASDSSSDGDSKDGKSDDAGKDNSVEFKKVQAELRALKVQMAELKETETDLRKNLRISEDKVKELSEENEHGVDFFRNKLSLMRTMIEKLTGDRETGYIMYEDLAASRLREIEHQREQYNRALMMIEHRRYRHIQEREYWEKVVQSMKDEFTVLKEEMEEQRQMYIQERANLQHRIDYAEPIALRHVSEFREMAILWPLHLPMPSVLIQYLRDETSAGKAEELRRDRALCMLFPEIRECLEMGRAAMVMPSNPTSRLNFPASKKLENGKGPLIEDESAPRVTGVASQVLNVDSYKLVAVTPRGEWKLGERRKSAPKLLSLEHDGIEMDVEASLQDESHVMNSDGENNIDGDDYATEVLRTQRTAFTQRSLHTNRLGSVRMTQRAGKGNETSDAEQSLLNLIREDLPIADLNSFNADPENGYTNNNISLSDLVLQSVEACRDPRLRVTSWNLPSVSILSTPIIDNDYDDDGIGGENADDIFNNNDESNNNEMGEKLSEVDESDSAWIANVWTSHIVKKFVKECGPSLLEGSRPLILEEEPDQNDETTSMNDFSGRKSVSKKSIVSMDSLPLNEDILNLGDSARASIQKLKSGRIKSFRNAIEENRKLTGRSQSSIGLTDKISGRKQSGRNSQSGSVSFNLASARANLASARSVRSLKSALDDMFDENKIKEIEEMNIDEIDEEQEKENVIKEHKQNQEQSNNDNKHPQQHENEGDIVASNSLLETLEEPEDEDPLPKSDSPISSHELSTETNNNNGANTNDNNNTIAPSARSVLSVKSTKSKTSISPTSNMEVPSQSGNEEVPESRKQSKASIASIQSRKSIQSRGSMNNNADNSNLTNNGNSDIVESQSRKVSKASIASVRSIGSKRSNSVFENDNILEVDNDSNTIAEVDSENEENNENTTGFNFIEEDNNSDKSQIKEKNEDPIINVQASRRNLLESQSLRSLRGVSSQELNNAKLALDSFPTSPLQRRRLALNRQRSLSNSNRRSVSFRNLNKPPLPPPSLSSTSSTSQMLGKRKLISSSSASPLLISSNTQSHQEQQRLSVSSTKSSALDPIEEEEEIIEIEEVKECSKEVKEFWSIPDEHIEACEKLFNASEATKKCKISHSCLRTIAVSRMRWLSFEASKTDNLKTNLENDRKTAEIEKEREEMILRHEERIWRMRRELWDREQDRRIGFKNIWSSSDNNNQENSVKIFTNIPKDEDQQKANDTTATDTTTLPIEDEHSNTTSNDNNTNTNEPQTSTETATTAETPPNQTEISEENSLPISEEIPSNQQQADDTEPIENEKEEKNNNNDENLSPEENELNSIAKELSELEGQLSARALAIIDENDSMNENRENGDDENDVNGLCKSAIEVIEGYLGFEKPTLSYIPNPKRISRVEGLQGTIDLVNTLLLLVQQRREVLGAESGCLAADLPVFKERWIVLQDSEEECLEELRRVKEEEDNSPGVLQEIDEQIEFLEKEITDSQQKADDCEDDVDQAMFMGEANQIKKFNDETIAELHTAREAEIQRAEDARKQRIQIIEGQFERADGLRKAAAERLASLLQLWNGTTQAHEAIMNRMQVASLSYKGVNASEPNTILPDYQVLKKSLSDDEYRFWDDKKHIKLCEKGLEEKTPESKMPIRPVSPRLPVRKLPKRRRLSWPGRSYHTKLQDLMTKRKTAFDQPQFLIDIHADILEARRQRIDGKRVALLKQIASLERAVADEARENPLHAAEREATNANNADLQPTETELALGKLYERLEKMKKELSDATQLLQEELDRVATEKARLAAIKPLPPIIEEYIQPKHLDTMEPMDPSEIDSLLQPSNSLPALHIWRSPSSSTAGIPTGLLQTLPTQQQPTEGESSEVVTHNIIPSPLLQSPLSTLSRDFTTWRALLMRDSAFRRLEECVPSLVGAGSLSLKHQREMFSRSQLNRSIDRLRRQTTAQIATLKSTIHSLEHQIKFLLNAQDEQKRTYATQMSQIRYNTSELITFLKQEVLDIREKMKELKLEHQEEFRKLERKHEEDVEREREKQQGLVIENQRIKDWLTAIKEQLEETQATLKVTERKFLLSEQKHAADFARLSEVARFEASKNERLELVVASLKDQIQISEDASADLRSEIQLKTEKWSREEKRFKKEIWRRDETGRRLCMDPDAILLFMMQVTASLAGSSVGANDRLGANCMAEVCAILCGNPRPEVARLAAQALGRLTWNGNFDIQVRSTWGRTTWGQWVQHTCERLELRLRAENRAWADGSANITDMPEGDVNPDEHKLAEAWEGEWQWAGEDESNESDAKDKELGRQTALRTAAILRGSTQQQLSDKPLDDEGKQVELKESSHESNTRRVIANANACLLALVKLCKSNDLSCQASAANAISIIALSSENREAILGCPDCLETCVRLCGSSDPEVQTGAASVLGNISFEFAKGQQTVADKGGIPALVDICGTGIPKKLAPGQTELDHQIQYTNIDGIENAVASLATILCLKSLGDKLAECGGITTLVKLIGTPIAISSPSIGWHAAQTLANATSELSSQNATKVQEAGVDDLVKLCTSEYLQIRIHGAMVLGNISQHDSPRLSVGKAGGVDALVILLSDNDDYCKEIAAWALSNLAWCSYNQDRLGRYLPDLLKVCEHELVEVARPSLSSMANALFYHDLNRARIFETTGLLERLVRLLTHDDSKCLEHACRALGAAAYDDNICLKLGEMGTITRFLKLCKHDSMAVRRFATFAICNLAINDKNKTLMLKEDTIEILVNLQGLMDKSIVEKASEALRILSDTIDTEHDEHANVTPEGFVHMLDSDNPMVQEMAAGRLSALASDELQDRVPSCGGINTILSAVTHHVLRINKLMIEHTEGDSLAELNLLRGASVKMLQLLRDVISGHNRNKRHFKLKSGIAKMLEVCDCLDRDVLNAALDVFSTAVVNNEPLARALISTGLNLLMSIASPAPLPPKIPNYQKTTSVARRMLSQSPRMSDEDLKIAKLRKTCRQANSRQAQDVLQILMPYSFVNCRHCGAKSSGGRVCGKCGRAIAFSKDSEELRSEKNISSKRPPSKLQASRSMILPPKRRY